MRKKLTEWDEFRKSLNISPEQEAEIQLEIDIIAATIAARKKANLSQRELSKISGIKQPAIARLERFKGSPRLDTMMKLLNSIGYTLRVVPLENKDK